MGLLPRKLEGHGRLAALTWSTLVLAGLSWLVVGALSLSQPLQERQALEAYSARRPSAACRAWRWSTATPRTCRQHRPPRTAACRRGCGASWWALARGSFALAEVGALSERPLRRLLTRLFCVQVRALSRYIPGGVSYGTGRAPKIVLTSVRGSMSKLVREGHLCTQHLTDNPRWCSSPGGSSPSS